MKSWQDYKAERDQWRALAIEYRQRAWEAEAEFPHHRPIYKDAVIAIYSVMASAVPAQSPAVLEALRKALCERLEIHGHSNAPIRLALLPKHLRVIVCMLAKICVPNAPPADTIPASTAGEEPQGRVIAGLSPPPPAEEAGVVQALREAAASFEEIRTSLGRDQHGSRHEAYWLALNARMHATRFLATLDAKDNSHG